MRIVKGETTRLDLLSPDAVAGLSLENDASGAPSVLSFQYSGITMELPKDVFSKVSLLMSFFSPEIPIQVEALKKDSLTLVQEEYTLPGLSQIQPYQATFDHAGISYQIIYDKDSGIPLVLTATCGDLSASVRLTKFKAD